MCDCFHLAFPNWHAASSGTAGRRLRAPEPGPEDDSTCDEPSQFTESERPRPQGSSPVEEYPETEKYTDSDKECEAEHDPHHKSGSGKKTKKSGLGSMFEKRSTPKMSKLKEVHSPESGLIVKTAKDGCAEGLVYGGGGKEGIFIKEVVPESPASKSLKLKEGDQILSATVYFDNVSYEDAIQILEHAQAYRVKLCLKRKPDITETETAIETDAIPEEDVYAPEMREQGKTKRRGDARISWPKFPSFGKGKKSRFIRSHSSSEADEQRKLELSPTTSDTESPIKSQDALKGKKKQKTKFSVLTKRGRISSSEDQDTDAPTSAQMVSPECFESPSGGTPQIFATEDLKVVEDFRREQNDQKLTEPQTVQHKVELITIDSTLKTEDLTVALAGQGSPSGIKSPDGKKNKKERSELKMKISGKDKLHKKDTKAKSSPKRLKTLGASIEIADQPGNEKSDEIPSFKSQTKLQGDQLALNANTQIISSESSRLEMSVPKVELEISDVALIGKSPQKGEEKTKKGKDVKQKLETKTGPIFKLPKIGFSDIATEEIIPQMNVNFEERTPKMEKFTTEGTEVKKYPHERLSKSSLPKREDIVIPGMEDMSKKTKVKGIKEPKAVFTGHYEDIQAETVDLSFDVDSVKEAVSKLPGFKLPKVDMSGVPIPEEITVIDANAQRISVKTPTKTKHDAHFSKFDITASPEISKTTVKLPKITSDDLTTEELLIESKVDLKKTEKEYKTQPKQSDKEHVIIPGKESVQVAAIFQTQETQGKDDIKSENESAVTLKSKRAKITMTSFGISKPDIRIPDIGIDFPKQKQQKGDNVKGERTIFLQEEEISKTETRNKIGEVISDVKIPESESIEYIDSVDGSPDKKDGGIGLTGFGVNLNAASPKTDISFPQIRGEVKGVEYKVHTFKLPEYGAVTENISIDMPDAEKDVKIDGADIRTIEREIKGGKFKMPNLSISMAKVKGPEIEKDVDLPLPEAKAEVELPDIPEVEVNLGNVDVSIPEKNMEVKKPELDVQPWQVEGELDGQGSKFKKPKFGIKIPKLKEPEFDLSLSKKDVHVTLPEVKSEVQVPEAPKMDDSLGKAEVLIPVAKVEVKKPELKIKPLHTDIELQGQGGEFQMPKLGITMPKLKGPEFDSSLSKKVVDVTLPEAKAEVQLPAAPEIDTTLGRINVSIPKQKMEVEKPELDIKPLRTEGELDGQGGKFKMPKLGVKMPKIKVPELDLGLSKKDVDVTLPEAKAELKPPDVEHTEHGIKVDVKAPEIAVYQQDVEGPSSRFKMPTFKLPAFGDGSPKVSVEAHDMDKEVKIDVANINNDVVNIKAPSIDLKGPSIDMKAIGTDLEGKESKFKMPHLGFSMPKVKGPQLNIPEASAEVKLPETLKIDASLGKAEFLIQEENIEVKEPEVKIKPLQTDVELEREGDTFKMPKLGKSMPKVKGPEIHFSLSKTDGDVTLPEAKAEVKVPEVELKEPSANVEIKGPEITEKDREGSPLKFKMPTFKLPKYGIGTPDMSVEISDMDKDVKINRADIKITEDTLAVDIAAPSIGIEGPSIDIKTTGTEHEGKGSKFKLPSLGFSGPPTKRPDVDLSLLKKDVDGTLPEAKADVKLPNIHTEAPRTDIEGLSIDLKTTGIEEDGKRSFKMPHLSFSMPRVKGPKMDLSLSDVDVKLIETKPDVKHPEVDLGKVDVSIPEAKMQVKKPEVEMQSRQTQGQLEGKGEKLKMPKFGIKMPTLRETEFDLSLSKRDVDIPLPQAKVKVKLPEAPKTDASLRKAEVFIPEAKMEDKKPKAELKPLQTEINIEGRGGKFQMPKFGITMPKVKGPEIDLSLSEKDVDVTIPNAKAEVKLPKAPEIALDMKPPACEAEIVGQGGKFKMPKFGISMPKVKGPEMDVSLSKKDVDVTLPKAKADVVLPEASEIAVDMKPQECEAEIDGQGGKYKTPKLGISMHKVKGPDFDFSLSKKDADITLPEAKTEVNLPDVELKEPSAKVEIKAPEIETQLSSVKGSPSKFKLPTFKFPKFGAATSNVSTELPDIDKEIKIDGADMQISVPDIDVDVPKVKAEIHLPEVEVKKPSGSGVIEQQPGVEVDAKLKKTRFSLPRFSFSKPTVKAPELDASLQDAKAITEGKVEVNVLIPETKAKVEEAELEVKPLQTEVKGQGSEFGMSMPKVKGPEFHLGLSKKDIDVRIPEAKADINFPDVDLKQPSAKIEMKAPVIEVLAKDTEGSPSKFKMPNFSFSMPKVKGQDVDVSLSKNDTDIPLAETKAEIKLPEAPKIDASLGKAEVLIPEERVDVKKPEVEIKPLRTDVELKGHGGEFQMPKFGIKMPKVKGPVIDLSFLKKDVDVTLPEAKADVVLPEPPKIAVDAKPLECEAEIDGQGGKFKMPKFGISMPKGKEPEIDVSFSRKDVDFTPPDTTAEVNISDVELKEPSAKVEIKAPEIKAQLSSVKGSPSKFQLPTFKFPKFGAATSNVSTELPDIDKEIKIDGADMQISVPDTDVDVPKVKAEIHLPEVEVQKPSGSGVIEQQPDIEVDAKPKKPRFSLPRFSFSKPSVKAPEVDASLQDAKVASKEGKVEVKGGEVDMKLLEYEAEVDGQGSRFKMPTFGISMPKGPEIDLTSSKKDVNVTLPEAKAKVQLSDVKIKQPAGQNKAPEMEAYTSNTKGSFTLPKFGAATPKVSVEVPDVDKDIKTDGATVDVTAPSIDTEGLSVDVKVKGSEFEGSGSKFKMPKFGISMPKVKGPEIDLSLSKKDVDVTLPEAKAEIKLPNVEVKESEVEIKAHEIKVATKGSEGSPSKFKMPTFKLPKFGVGTPIASVDVPNKDRDFKTDGGDIKIPEEVLAVDIAAPSIDTEGPSIDIKTTGTEHEGKGSRFKLPSLGFSGPQIKQPDIDLSLSKKDVDVTLPEAKAGVKLPDVELKESSAKVEIKAPGIDVQTSNVEGSPSKLKMPTFTLPKFGAAIPQVSVEVPDVDKDFKIGGADLQLPGAKAEGTIPDAEIKVSQAAMTEGDAKLRKTSWTLPRFSFSKTNVKAPEAEVNLNVPKVDITLPEAKKDVQLPDFDIKESSCISIETDLDAKLKKTSFSLPKFSFSKQSSMQSKVDVSITDVDVSLPEGNVEVKQPEVELNPPEADVELEGHESKFKTPMFGFSMPKVKGPEIDMSLSKKNVEVTLPEARAKVQLPDVKIKQPSATVEMKAPKIEAQTVNVQGSPSKLKMPTFTLPKFGAATPKVSVEVPDVDKDIIIDGAIVDVTAPSTDAEGLSVDLKAKGSKHEGSGSKFKMPSLGFSGPQIKRPDINLNSPKKDVDVTLPEAKAEVKLPDLELKESSAKVEIEAPEIKIATKVTEGSPSKYKMPTFKLPKFGIRTPSATVEVPDREDKIDGNEIKIPEEVLAVDIAAPSIDTEGPSIDIKTTGTEHEGKGSKFKLPSLGFSGPPIKRPDINLSSSKKDVDVTLPEAKAEVKLPDLELKESSAKVEIEAPELKIATKVTEGSPSKYKMPTFKLPKFGIGTPSATVEVPNREVKIDGDEIKIPEEMLAVDIAAPSIDTEGPSMDFKTTGTEHEGKGSKFKLPSFSRPQIQRPDINLNSSKKDVDVTLPEAKAEVKLPDLELKESSAKVEIKAPEIKIATKVTEGSPSKYKMPTFKLPKFGIGTPSSTIEVPNREVKIVGDEIKIPEEVLAVDIAAPSIDTEGPSIDIKTTGTEHEEKGSKFKLPSLGFSGPQIKQPDIDLSLSKKDVDVRLPEAKAGVKLPDVELKESSAKVEIKAPGIDVQTSNVERSPSNLKMPTFTLPKFGAVTSHSSVKLPDMDKVVKGNGADLKLPEAKAEGKIPDAEIKESDGSISVSQAPMIEGEGKLRKTSWTLPRFSFSKSNVKAPEADVNLDVPKVDIASLEAKTDVQLPDIDTKESSGTSIEGAPTDLDAKLKKHRFTLPKFSFSKQSSKESKDDVSLPDNVSLPEGNVEVKHLEVELKPPEADVELEGQERKFKMPMFGFSMPKVKGPDTDLSLSKNNVDVTLPETKAEIQLPDVKIKQPSATVEMKAPKIEPQTVNVEGSPSKLKMPTFTFPKFGAATPKVSVEVPDVDKDIKTDGATVDVTAPSIDTEGLSVDVKAKGIEIEGPGSKFNMPKFGISMPKVKGPEIDLKLSKKDVDVTIPEAKAEVQLPDVKIKQPSATVEMKAPKIEAQTGNVEGSPSKLKMPTFTFPKFGAATPKVSVEVPDVDKDIKTDGATVDVTAPSIDTEGLSVDVKAKGSEIEGPGSKFKMPKFGISMSKVKGPDIDLSLSKKDVDVTIPEATTEIKLPSVEVKESEGAILIPDVPTVDVENKFKRPNWSFPKFSFSRTGGKTPDPDVNLETPKVDVTSPEAKSEVQGLSGAISMEVPPAAELDETLKKNKFTLPRFSFSKSSVKEPEVSAELPDVDFSLPEREVIVKQPEIKMKAPEPEVEHDGQESKFKLPKFGIALPKAKGKDLKASQKDVGITLPEVKAEVKLPEIESSASVEMKASDTEAKSKGVGGSPLKFKMPTLKMPTFGVATYDVTVGAPDADKVAETDGAKLKEDVTFNIKGPSVDIKTDVSKDGSETPKTEAESVGLGSPSKFKLPTFKMPKLSFSRPNPEDEHVPVDTECKENQVEMDVKPKGESKSAKVTLTSFGEILKNIDVEFDVPKTEEHLETSKEVHETDETSGKQLEAKEKETNQDTTKSPERTGWFKFPKFGLSSPSEPTKISEKDMHKDEKTPVGETVEEISPTFSVQSSDAFADISSAMTSEHAGLSLSSPTKVTVKYSEPMAATGLEEMHSNITSTTRTELISIEPNLPEKITILSSGVSSSSEDTLRLESGKIHVITSNIQATPEAQRAELLTAVQIQSAEGLLLESEANEAASWTVEDSQSSKKTVFERHLVMETSTERSESKETIVITKQITSMFDSSEPTLGATASSIQRLRESVHSEKMRFFDEADK